MAGDGDLRPGGPAAVPQDLRRLKLRYDAVCTGCYTALQRGRWAHWSRAAKGAWCLDCAPSPTPLSHKAAGGSPGPAVEVGRRDRGHGNPWQQLCDYTRLCLEAEAADGIERFNNEQDAWWRHGAGAEELIAGSEDSISAPPLLGRSMARVPAGELPQFVYGWPTLVFAGEARYVSVAPLFRVTVEPERTPDGRWVLNAVTDPEFNTALAPVARFDRATVDELAEELDEGVPFGDAASFVALVDVIVDRLGVDVHTALEPGGLNGYLTRRDGLYNCAVTIRAKGQFLGGVIRELRYLRDRTDWADTAACFLLPGAAAALNRRGPRRRGGVVSPMESNYSQEDALERLAVDPVTVITGPPGTGKTQLVVNAVAGAWARGETMLVASVNNAAVDVPTQRAAEAVCPGLLLRTGNRQAREGVAQQVHRAVTWATVPGEPGRPAAARAAHKIVATSRGRFLDDLAELSQIDAGLLTLAEDAADRQLRAESQSREIWGCSQPEGFPSLSDRDKRRIPRLVGSHWFLARWGTRRIRAKYGLQPATPLQDLAEYAEAADAALEASNRLGYGETRRQDLSDRVGDVAARLAEHDRMWEEAGARWVAAEVAETVGRNGVALDQTFDYAPSRAKAFRKAVGRGLKDFKGWGCTALSASANFPLKAAMFDLVVIDEASQCTVASVLPLLYRSKRVAVVGDPRQLQPVVTVSPRRLAAIATQAGYDAEDLEERGLDHGASVYSAFDSHVPKPPVLLDEHYRSHPRIAAWFNKTFYGGRLAVLTDLTTARAGGGITWLDVDGTATRGSNGSWVNDAEARRAVSELQNLLGTGSPLTVGFLSPFRGQAELVDRLLQQHMPPEVLAAADFRAGTAHALQGNERDTIVFSTVVAPGMTDYARAWVEKERHLVNVAVSRARHTVVVIGHPDVAQLDNPTIASLRSDHRHESQRSHLQHHEASPTKIDSKAEQALYDAAMRAGIPLTTKPDVGGYELDFAIKTPKIKLNIEVDGPTHIDARGRQRRQDIARDRRLTERGWVVHRIPAWRCHKDPDAEIRLIADLLK